MSDEKLLTKEIVEQFLEDYESVVLSEFTVIEDDAATRLSEYRGCFGLDLGGMSELSDTAAESLSKHVGNLYLTGLTELSDAAAVSLSKQKGELFFDRRICMSVAAGDCIRKQNTTRTNSIPSPPKRAITCPHYPLNSEFMSYTEVGFSLSCGREVYLESFRCARTYKRIIEGRPSQSFNEGLLADLNINYADDGWHIIQPEVYNSDPDHPALPPFRIDCELRSYDEDGGETGLQVCLFSKDIMSQPITTIIVDAVRDIEWDVLAVFNPGD